MKQEKYLIIKSRKVGFFSLFLQVLGNLEWCNKNEYVPIIDFTNEDCLYWTPEGYNNSLNAWNYFFEAHESYLLEPPGDKKENILVNDSYHPSNEFGLGIDDHGSEWNDNPPLKFRIFVHSLIEKHIRIRHEIKEKVDVFYDQYMNGHNICGVHVRRTDSTDDPLKRPPLLDAYFREIDRYFKFSKDIETSPNVKILLATDDASVIQIFKDKYKDNLLLFDSVKSENGMALHLRKDLNKAKLGEEVLVECLLLSQCDFLVHSRSNVSSVALYFNPDLDHIYINPMQPLTPIKAKMVRATSKLRRIFLNRDA
jgi:hypothetical protein